MSQPLAHTIFTLIQQLEPAAKDELLAMLQTCSNDKNAGAQSEITNVHVQPGGAIRIKEKSMHELNKIKKWSKEDFKNAVAYLRLPAGLNKFFTDKNMI